MFKPRFTLGALDARVFARVDGSASVHAIARVVGYAPAEVMSILERLERLGAVCFDDAQELAAEELEEELPITVRNVVFDRPTRPNV